MMQRRAAPQQRRFFAVHRPLETPLSEVVSCRIDLPSQTTIEQLNFCLDSSLTEDALRVVFTVNSSGLWQIPVPHDAKYSIEVIDLRAGGEAWEAQYRTLLHRENARLYRPTEWPLFRVHVVRKPVGGDELLMHVHHLVFDGQSRHSLVRRFKHMLMLVLA